MARYHVIMADPNTNEIHGAIVRARHPVHAILQHPWICEVYKEDYVQKNFHSEDQENCCQNIFNFTSWSTLCVNLDEEIMKDLNGGDSNVSSSTPQE